MDTHDNARKTHRYTVNSVSELAMLTMVAKDGEMAFVQSEGKLYTRVTEGIFPLWECQDGFETEESVGYIYEASEDEAKDVTPQAQAAWDRAGSGQFALKN